MNYQLKDWPFKRLVGLLGNSECLDADSECSFVMEIFLMKKLGALRAHALRFALHLMTIMNTWN